MSQSVYIALLHTPVYNKRMETITTSITNLDVHDISRAARTYGIQRFYLVHPLESQRNLAGEMISYWQEGYGGEYNPDRKDALSILNLKENLDQVIAEITAIEGIPPRVVATDAREYPNTISYTALRRRIEAEEGPHLVIFGTGWGLTQEMMDSCDFILEPIRGPVDYNHLSVRSAVSIILDRLQGEKWW